jgi:hypothetical protein
MPSDESLMCSQYRVDSINKFIHKKVTVKTSDNKEECGLLVAADPISQSCVLLTAPLNKSDPIKSEFLLVPCVNWSDISLHPDQSTLDQESLQLLSQLTTESTADTELTADLQTKLEDLHKFMLQHNLTAEIQGVVLSVQNCVCVHPPYTSADCRATNEIVLDRVANLVNTFNNKI